MDWDHVVAEFKENKKPLAIVSVGVFFITFILFLSLRGCSDDAPPLAQDNRKQQKMKREDGFAKKSFTGLLDSKLPVNTPHADFNRSLSGGTVQLTRRSYALTDNELDARLKTSNRVASEPRTNPASPATGEKKQQPEIDMILKRPVSRPGKRSTY